MACNSVHVYKCSCVPVRYILYSDRRIKGANVHLSIVIPHKVMCPLLNVNFILYILDGVEGGCAWERGGGVGLNGDSVFPTIIHPAGSSICYDCNVNVEL